MKALLVLLCCGVSVSAFAQLADGDLKKITAKNLRLLQTAKKLNPLTPLSLVQPGLREVLLLQQDNMPCLVPYITAITPIPNVLPELTVPDVAAIPNPALPNYPQKSTIPEPGLK